MSVVRTTRWRAETPEERDARHRRRDSTVYWVPTMEETARGLRRRTLHFMYRWSVAAVLKREAEDRLVEFAMAARESHRLDQADRSMRTVPKGQVLHDY